MRKMSIKNIKSGCTVYYVHAMGKNSSVIKYKVTNRPFMNRNIGMFVNVEYFPKLTGGSSLNTHFSLEDCNVIQNCYNDHRLFFSRKKAESYCKLCKKLGIDSSIRLDLWFDHWGPFYDGLDFYDNN